jgi:hypothetical protein
MTEPVDFDRIASEEAPQAERIAEWFAIHHATETILDVGCGPGIYVEAMRRQGLNAFGVDGDERLVESKYLHKIDIIAEGIVPVRGVIDVVVSLEVGEHIPEADARTYVNYLTTQACPDAIYFSAARPGQGGEGHINCQIKAYWLRLFCKRGYYFHPEATEAFLAFLRSGPHMGWAVQNAMILERAR